MRVLGARDTQSVFGTCAWNSFSPLTRSRERARGRFVVRDRWVGSSASHHVLKSQTHKPDELQPTKLNRKVASLGVYKKDSTALRRSNPTQRITSFLVNVYVMDATSSNE